MPFGWACQAWCQQEPIRPALLQAATPFQLSPDLSIKSGVLRLVPMPDRHYEIVNGDLVYGLTDIRADLIELYPDGKAGVPLGSGFAHGHVQVSDPAGTLTADDASFNWIRHTGGASNATIKSEGIRLTAARVRVEPGVWTLDVVRAEPEQGRFLGHLVASQAVIRPGSGLTAYEFAPSLLGVQIGGFHRVDYPFNPSHGLGGDLHPAPSWSADTGFGLGYRPRYLIDERTAVAGTYSVAQAALPTYGLQFARSFLAAGESEGLVVPRSDLDNRFAFGYFDSVGIDSPTEEHREIGIQRYNLSFGSFQNIQAFDRKGDEVFDKPFEVTAERAFGTRQSFAVITDNTFQQIHELGGSDHDRFLNATTVAFPLIRLAPQVTTRIRFDGAGFVNPQSLFSWVQGQVGLVYRPSELLRFGAAYNAAHEFGTPLYLADELYSTNSFNLRSDIEVGPRQLSLLLKYDTERRRWYDSEVELYQSVGPIRFFARFRTFPSQFTFGGELRLDSVLKEVETRNPGRPSHAPKLAD